MQITTPQLFHDEVYVIVPRTRAAQVRLRLRGPTLMAALVATALGLLALHLVVVSSYLGEWRFPARDRFYFDHENNLPTFFSSFLWMLAGALAGVVGAARRAADDRFARHWQGMALIFALLAIDEAASFHELLIHPLRTAFHLDGLLWFGWVVPGFAFACAFAAAYRRFLTALPAGTRRLLIAAGTVYVCGAVGLEMLGGQLFLAGQATQDLVPYMVAMTLEESMEMAGVLLLIRALLRHLAACCGDVRVQVQAR